MKFLQDLDENQFWVIIWTIGVTAFILFTLTVSSCEIHNNELKSELLKKGYSPMDIRCMYATNEDIVCIRYMNNLQNPQQSKVNENEISSGD